MARMIFSCFLSGLAKLKKGKGDGSLTLSRKNVYDKIKIWEELKKETG
jgi:hypothetical protein